MLNRTITSFLFLSVIFSQIIAQTYELPAYKNSENDVETRVKDLLSRMTLEEKVDLLGGENLNTKENKRLGIPKILMTDGPLGPTFRKHSTNYSAMINLAASFDTDLMRRVAESIGEETRVMGRNMLLAPMINIIRLPHWGRSFEVFSEDPYLSSRMTVAYVKGVQSKNVIACTKVMTANNQEWNRIKVDAQIDGRAMREIYFPSMKAAVKEADTWSVMTSYNKVNGDYGSESKYLLTDLLKNEWGFDGFVVSDWNGTHSTVKMAKAGLDLEMPFAKFYGKKLIEAVNKGEIAESTVDDKVSRILKAMFKAELFDESAASYGGHSNTPERNALAREAAQKSIVLLKNDNNFLPLQKDKIKSIAVIGPNGDVARMTAGGSGDLTGNYGISPYEGIVNQVGKNIKVGFERGVPEKKTSLPIAGSEYFMLEDGKPGIKAEYFNSINLEGEPVLIRIEKNIEFNWNPATLGESDAEYQVGNNKDDDKGSPKTDVINPDNWSARWTGLLKSPGTGVYEIGFLSNNGFKLYLDGEKILDNWLDGLPAQLKSTRFTFKAGHVYKIRIEFYEETGTAHCYFGFEPYVPDTKKMNEALSLACKSDVVILSLGLNKKMEGEANDRTELGLNVNQLELLKEVVAVNKNTVVVLNNGTPITMNEWIDDVPAIIDAFYPGQEGGNALADILFGDVNPSGKLPVTFLKRWEDSPAYGTYPGLREKAMYKEGIFVGYRHFDKENIEPLFPFGFGLSYTTFEFNVLKLSKTSMNKEDELIIELTVKNTGEVEGDEIVQIYISDKEASVEREVKSLKGFARVSLKPGESKTVSMKIDQSALSFYDVESKSWVVEPGEFEILVGNSSRNVLLKGSFIFE